MKLFKDSSKKHLLITGSKGIGKSTLLKELLIDCDNYGGITTHLIMNEDLLPKTVVLKDILNRDIKAIIGKRYIHNMEPVIIGFEDIGSSILYKYRNSDKELIVIDEIGFLEINAKRYQEEIFLCFKEKNVIAVLRKQDNPLINKIKEIKDIFIVDLDEIV